MLIYLLIICLSVLFLLFVSREKHQFSTIPGPKPLPIVGNSLLFVQGNFEITLLKTMRSLQKEYGNVVKFYVGNILVLDCA